MGSSGRDDDEGFGEPSPRDAHHAVTSSLLRGPELTLAAVDLTVLEGPDRGRRQRLATGTVRVGTGPSCEIRLADPTVSRLHCTLEVTPRGVHVVDLGSTNGVWIQGVRLEDGLLPVGATRSRIA